MDKSIIFEGKELLRIVLKNCTYADLLEIIGKINLPRDSTMTSVIFSEIKEAYITIRCKTSELEKIQSKLEIKLSPLNKVILIEGNCLYNINFKL